MDMKVKIELIKAEREKRGWTQSHLAEICDLSLRTIQRIEKLGLVSHESIQSLSAAFDLKVDDLLVVDELASAAPAVCNKPKPVKWPNKTWFWLGSIGMVITALMHMLMAMALGAAVHHAVWLMLYLMWIVFLCAGVPKELFEPASEQQP